METDCIDAEILIAVLAALGRLYACLFYTVVQLSLQILPDSSEWSWYSHPFPFLQAITFFYPTKMDSSVSFLLTCNCLPFCFLMRLERLLLTHGCQPCLKGARTRAVCHQSVHTSPRGPILHTGAARPCREPALKNR